MSAITYHVDHAGHFCAHPDGVARFDPGIVAGLIRDLGDPDLRNWEPRQSETPEPPVAVIPAGDDEMAAILARVDECQAVMDGPYVSADDERFWTPKLRRDGCVVEWRPMSEGGRRIVCDLETGRVSWDTGTGRPSYFIGRALSACAMAQAQVLRDRAMAQAPSYMFDVGEEPEVVQRGEASV